MSVLAKSWCVLVLVLGPAGALAQSGGAAVPDAPVPQGLRQRPPRDPNAVQLAREVMVNGRPYTPPTQHELLVDYLKESYGLPALERSTVRWAYNQALGQPKGWGEDAAGTAQRFASNMGITAITGNVRYGMEEVFHEDLRYIPCHGCNLKHKVENALLAEITARHDRDGHRFFTLTPTIADFSGPIIARALWYPANENSLYGGFISSRTVFATRIGTHLFQEIVLERRHHDDPERPRAAVAPAAAPAAAAAPAVGGGGNPGVEY